MASNSDDNDFQLLVEEATKGISSVREVVQTLMKSSALDTKDGISLLSLKNNILLSYMQSLTLLSAHRILGHSLGQRTPPPEPFTHPTRGVRGTGAGDIVDTLLEDRVVLEKVKQLEDKMRYQINKLVKIASEESAVVDTSADIINDPLIFRPNPQNLQDGDLSESEAAEDEPEKRNDQIYRPPKLAPMPYIEKTHNKSKSAKASIPVGLASLLPNGDGTNPHVESTSGLGIIPSMVSSRARELARMNEFEEENMTRLVMSKKETRRRLQDEGDVALGGTGILKGRRRGGGIGDEFDDLLRSVDHGSGRVRTTDNDGYEALRVKGRKQDALSRSRTRDRDDDDGGGDNQRPSKKSRFQTQVNAMARKKRRS